MPVDVQHADSFFQASRNASQALNRYHNTYDIQHVQHVQPRAIRAAHGITCKPADVPGKTLTVQSASVQVPPVSDKIPLFTARM
jgi:hypothetical protein